MKSFIAFTVLSLAASFSNAAPLCEPLSTATVTTTVTVDGPNPTPAPPFATPTGPPFTPKLPLQSYQRPVILPNGNVALGAYLQVSVDAATPDTTILETQQIGPDTYLAFEFNSTHADKLCRFHFSFSAGDGSNDVGSEDIYPLTSGIVDEKLTFNNKPVSRNSPIASFLPLNPATGQRYSLGDSSNDDFLLHTSFKTDFHCPTEPTSWEVRGAGTPKSSANWSWNHGLIIEIADKEENFWSEGLVW